MLRMKGPTFVQALRDAHPNLNRPYIRNPVVIRDIPPYRSENASMETEEVTENNAQTNVNIDQLLNMGFSKERIDRALER